MCTWYCCSDGATALGTAPDGALYKVNACTRRILLWAPPSTCLDARVTAAAAAASLVYSFSSSSPGSAPKQHALGGSRWIIRTALPSHAMLHRNASEHRKGGEGKREREIGGVQDTISRSWTRSVDGSFRC